MRTRQSCIEPLEQLACGTERRAVVLNGRDHRCADKNLAARIPLALGVAHARSEALPFGAETRVSSKTCCRSVTCATLSHRRHFSTTDSGMSGWRLLIEFAPERDLPIATAVYRCRSPQRVGLMAHAFMMRENMG